MNEVNKQFCPVILAGGGGTRLWPLSREHYPKQFLSFSGETSMLQQTLLRVCNIAEPLTNKHPIMICNEEHRFLVQEHAAAMGFTPSEIILEPSGRNTAPALTIAAIHTIKDDPVLLITPADHLIANINEFQDAVRAGYTEALNGNLVTFGIKPDSPETGFGYIRSGDQIGETSIYNVDSFVEKPDLQTATEYLTSGKYYWNSGIFMMKSSVWIEAIKAFRPDIYAACNAVIGKSEQDGAFYRLHDSFRDCPSDSIDYAVMEKLCEDDSKFNLVMVEMDPGWSDLGSWSAIFEVHDRDKSDNVTHGDVLTHNTRSSIIQSHGRLVTTFGCENLLIIETPDAVLVGNRENAQDVKHIVEKLKAQERDEAITHQRVYRPWGSYETLDIGKNYQVKRLIVNPGKKLSLQLHNQRAEHWVVVKGTATVTIGEKTFDLQVNQSTYIPLGEKHRLENKYDTSLEVIEVQSGDYLGEDDIVRFEDDFGRHK